MARRDHARGRRGGFTLLETLIAMSLLAVSLLSLSAMQLLAREFGNRGRHTTQAAAIAQTQLEQMQRDTWTNLATTGGWTTAVTVDNDVQAGTTLTEQSYAVSWRITDAVAGSTRNIDVRVRWDEPGRANRQYAVSSMRFNYEGL